MGLPQNEIVTLPLFRDYRPQQTGQTATEGRSQRLIVALPPFEDASLRA